MRDLSEIITRAALRKIDELHRRAQKHSRRVDDNLIADRMASLMGAPVPSTRKQLRRYLYDGHIWRVDYVQAFCQAVGVTLEDLMNPPANIGVLEATSQQFIWSALGERLTPKEARVLIRINHTILDNPARSPIAHGLAEIALSATSADEALVRASKLFHQYEKVFTKPIVDLRSRPPRKKRVIRKGRNTG